MNEYRELLNIAYAPLSAPERGADGAFRPGPETRNFTPLQARETFRVAVLGAGYVGLVTSACLADLGHHVTCIDLDGARIERLNAGQVPIFEPGLDALMLSNIAVGRLRFAAQLLPEAEWDVLFIAVGTPASAAGEADLSQVRAAAAGLALPADRFSTIVVKSTVPVGTGDEVEAILRARHPEGDFAVVSNPEFLREGQAVGDFMRPDRILVGTDERRARHLLAKLYGRLNEDNRHVVFTDRRTAELTKYAANAFLAMKLSFINEMADLCERAGADVSELAMAIGMDGRIGPHFLRPGPGYGGSCFPKDTAALISTARRFGSPLHLVETTAAINMARPSRMLGKIAASWPGGVMGKTVTLLGLSFKANTDDLRESPALDIARELLEAGASVSAYDPLGHRARLPFGGIALHEDPYAAAQDAHALVLATEWDEFRGLDFGRLRAAMHDPVLIDLRNFFHRAEVEQHGFRYDCVGRPAAELAEGRFA